MAKPKTPLLSFDAHGTLGGVLTHPRHKGVPVAEKKPIPTDQRTPAQLIWRALFRLGCDWWPAIPETQRWIYHQMNPQIGAYPAYLNFMKEWLMTQVVAHHEQHELAGADPIDVTGLVGAGGDLDRARYLELARYHYSPLLNRRSLGQSNVLVAGRIYLVPFPIPTGMSFDRIAVNILSASTGSIRLGIYNDIGNIYPTWLITDAGTVAATFGHKTIAIAETIPASLIWVAIMAQATPTVPTDAYYGYPVSGTADSRNGTFAYWEDIGWGALPDPFPGGANRDAIGRGITLRRSS